MVKDISIEWIDTVAAALQTAAVHSSSFCFRISKASGGGQRK